MFSVIDEVEVEIPKMSNSGNFQKPMPLLFAAIRV